MTTNAAWLDAWGQAVYGAPPIAPRPPDGPAAAAWEAGWAAGETARTDQAQHDARQLAALRGSNG